MSGFLQAQWQVDAAVLKLHSRRCTCLEFHPTRDNIVLSGDKKGQVPPPARAPFLCVDVQTGVHACGFVCMCECARKRAPDCIPVRECLGEVEKEDSRCKGGGAKPLNQVTAPAGCCLEF